MARMGRVFIIILCLFSSLALAKLDPKLLHGTHFYGQDKEGVGYGELIVSEKGSWCFYRDYADHGAPDHWHGDKYLLIKKRTGYAIVLQDEGPLLDLDFNQEHGSALVFSPYLSLFQKED